MELVKYIQSHIQMLWQGFLFSFEMLSESVSQKYTILYV